MPLKKSDLFFLKKISSAGLALQQRPRPTALKGSRNSEGDGKVEKPKAFTALLPSKNNLVPFHFSAARFMPREATLFSERFSARC